MVLFMLFVSRNPMLLAYSVMSSTDRSGVPPKTAFPITIRSYLFGFNTAHYFFQASFHILIIKAYPVVHPTPQPDELLPDLTRIQSKGPQRVRIILDVVECNGVRWRRDDAVDAGPFDQRWTISCSEALLRATSRPPASIPQAVRSVCVSCRRLRVMRS